MDAHFEYQLGHYDRVVLYLVLYATVLVAAAVKPLGYTIRAAVFPLALYLPAAYFLFGAGIGSLSLGLFLGAVVFAGILLGLRGGIAMFVVSILTIAVIGWFHVRWHLPVHGSLEESAREPMSWITQSMAFTFMAVAALLTHSALLRGLQQATESARDSVAELKAEIAARREAETALHESERHFRQLIENASDVIALMEEDGKVRYSSPSVERVLGHSRTSIWAITCLISSIPMMSAWPMTRSKRCVRAEGQCTTSKSASATRMAGGGALRVPARVWWPRTAPN
ncbi:MAG: PAS domain S-box protein [bacterium]|nr:PAS domain S-box protein [bacterium]